MQFRATKNTRAENAAEKRYVAWIKQSELCCGCGNHGPVIAHHAVGHSFKHLKTLIGHWFVIGLCQRCDDVVTHGSRKLFREIIDLPCKLWEESIEQFMSETGEAPPEEVRFAIMDWRF